MAESVNPCLEGVRGTLLQKFPLARAEERAGLLFEIAKVVHVFDGAIHKTDVAVDGGEHVMGFAAWMAKKVLDRKGAIRVSPDNLQCEVKGSVRGDELPG